jgi:hypothetical protein
VIDLLAALRGLGGKHGNVTVKVKVGKLLVDETGAPLLDETAPAVVDAMRANWRSGLSPDGTEPLEPPTASTKDRRRAKGGNPNAVRGVSSGRLLGSLRHTKVGDRYSIGVTEVAPGQLARALGPGVALRADLRAASVSAAMQRGLRKLFKTK